MIRIIDKTRLDSEFTQDDSINDPKEIVKDVLGINDNLIHNKTFD